MHFLESFFFLRIHLKIFFILEKYQALYNFFFDVPKILTSGLWHCKRQCKWRRILKWVLFWSRLIKKIQVTIGLSFCWPLYVFVYILRHNILLQIIKICCSDIWISQKQIMNIICLRWNSWISYIVYIKWLIISAYQMAIQETNLRKKNEQRNAFEAF